MAATSVVHVGLGRRGGAGRGGAGHVVCSTEQPANKSSFFPLSSISQQKISSVAVSPSGEWLAFGCSSMGQLLVWEWQSESYVLKQQGHYYEMSCLAYSPGGDVVATGGEDGKVEEGSVCSCWEGFDVSVPLCNIW